MPEIAQQLLNWVSLGSTYSLLAIGFTLLFGVINIIHFSHGDVSLLAPFVFLALVQGMIPGFPGGMHGISVVVAVVVTILAIGGLGVLLDRLVISRFRDAPAMMALVATVALGIVLRELLRHIFPFGSAAHSMPSLVVGSAFSYADVSIRWFTLISLGASVLLVAAVFLILHRTTIGIHIRAVSQDREAARLMGIDPKRVFAVSFFMASAIGAVAGLFYTSHIGFARFDLGIMAGLMGFSAAVIGGLGSIAGAIVGGMMLAGLETFVQAVVPSGTAYRQVYAFALVIVVLVFRPIGLLGKPVDEKV